MLKSQLLMAGVARMLRPEVAKAPTCARMNCALGLLATYATVFALRNAAVAYCEQGPPLQSAVTSLLNPGVPAVLMITRSPAASPFRLESAELCGVAYSGDSTV